MKSSYLKLVVSLVWLFAIAAVILLVISFKKSPQVSIVKDGHVTIISATKDQSRSGKYFVFPQGNFEFIPGSDWKEIATTSLTLPKNMSGVQFAFRRNDSSCVFAYVYTPEKLFYPDYKQTYANFRVRTVDGDQLDPWYYTHKDFLPDDYQFRFETEWHKDHEVAISYYPGYTNTNGSIAHLLTLYDDAGGQVSEDCAQSYAVMMTSLREYVSPVKVDATTVGDLYFGYDTAQNRHLYFLADPNSVVARVADLKIDSYPEPKIFGNTVYFTVDGKLKKFDPFTQTTTDFPNLKMRDKSVINEFYVYGNSIYYLEGVSCNDYRAKCDNNLYEYNLVTHANPLLAEHSDSRLILGLNKKEGTLGMMYSDGDAGCAWTSLEKYNVKLGTVQKIGSYGWCSDDMSTTSAPTSDEMAYLKFKANYDRLSTPTDYIRIDHGTILPPDGTRIPLRFQNIGLEYIYQ